jgi:L-Ala-D/L-Glu epimerase
LHSKLKLDVTLESWQMTAPLRISGYIMQDIPVLVVGLSDGSFRGLFYLGDWPADMLIQVEAVRGSIEAGISREALRELLPAGGARNAVDCALWELESMQAGMSVERLAGVEEAGSLLTTCTIGADSPLAMAHVAVEKYRNAKALKLKLLGDDLDAPRVRAVRKARPDVWLGVDGNQGFSVEHLAAMQPALMDARVSLIEQPFKVGQEALLDGFDRPIPIAADESVQSLPDMAVLAGRFDAVNIKLDKCGGLTEALLMMAEARRLGLKVMVGNMGGTSLAMAPAMVIGSGCDIVDLDGPLFLTADRVPGVVYRHGMVSVEPGTWGWCRPA